MSNIQETMLVTSNILRKMKSVHACVSVTWISQLCSLDSLYAWAGCCVMW